jgi:hypothetical protein
MSSTKKMVLVVMGGLLALAGSVDAALLLDTFDTYAAGSNLRGQGGWTDLFNEGATTQDPRILGSGGFNSTNGVEAPDPGAPAAASIDVKTHFLASTSGGGSYTASVDFHQKPNQTSTNLGQGYLYLGDTASMTSDTGGNHSQMWIQVVGTGAIGYHNRVNGSVTQAIGGSNSYDRDAHGWIRLKMVVNSTNTSVTASVEDINDTTGEFISTIDSHTFSGTSFATIEMAGIRHANQGWGTLDNFSSSPEPTTAVMLVLGGGLLLRRRRAA